MTEQHDALMQRLAELTDTIKSGHTDPAVLDWDQAAEQFAPLIKAQVDAGIQEKMDRQPVRSGHPIYAHNVDKAFVSGELTHANRYAKMVKHIAQDGSYRAYTGDTVKAVDLWLAHKMLERVAADNAVRKMSSGNIGGPTDDLKAAIKALSSTGSGTGDELVPTDYADELWEDVHLANVLASNLMPIDMTSNPMELPNALGDVTFRKGTENTATTSSDPATAKSTLTVTEEVAEVDWSYSLDEDAIVALMPAVRQTIARNAAEYMDGFCLNADSTATATGNINNDDGTPGADSYYLTAGQDGIRHQWLVDNTSNSNNMAGNLTDATINLAMAQMGKYAANPRDMLIIPDVWTYIRGFLNATTANAPGTFLKSEGDTPGFNVIVNNQIASYRGAPLVIPTMANKAEADGKLSVTAASNTLGSLSIINRTQWRVGYKRQMEIEVDRDIQKRQIIMVVSFRIAVGCRGTRSSATHTAGLRNITVAS